MASQSRESMLSQWLASLHKRVKFPRNIRSPARSMKVTSMAWTFCEHRVLKDRRSSDCCCDDFRKFMLSHCKFRRWSFHASQYFSTDKIYIKVTIIYFVRLNEHMWGPGSAAESDKSVVRSVDGAQLYPSRNNIFYKIIICIRKMEVAKL